MLEARETTVVAGGVSDPVGDFHYSRYLLACAAVPQITTAHVQPILTELFRSHGLPRALRTDNGSPFANRTGLGGLVKLSVWLLKLDICAIM